MQKDGHNRQKLHPYYAFHANDRGISSVLLLLKFLLQCVYY